MRRALAFLATPAPWPAPDATLPARGDRPLGVTILAVLNALGGIAMVLGGIVFALVGGIGASFAPVFGALGALFAAFLGLMMLLFGVVFLVVAYGFWQGQAWAWTLSLVLILLGILGGVLNLLQGEASGIMTLLIDGFLLWYIARPGVQRWFGKEGAWPAPQLNGMLGSAGTR